MSDLSLESVQGALTPAEVAAKLPGNVHRATVLRWIAEGCRGVKLETILVGGRQFVLPAQLEEFLDRLNADRRLPARADDDRVADAEAQLKALLK